jgi:hypothetical protein
VNEFVGCGYIEKKTEGVDPNQYQNIHAHVIVFPFERVDYR